MVVVGAVRAGETNNASSSFGCIVEVIWNKSRGLEDVCSYEIQFLMFMEQIS